MYISKLAFPAINQSLHAVLISDIQAARFPLDWSRGAVCPCLLFPVRLGNRISGLCNVKDIRKYKNKCLAVGEEAFRYFPIEGPSPSHKVLHFKPLASCYWAKPNWISRPPTSPCTGHRVHLLLDLTPNRPQSYLHQVSGIALWLHLVHKRRSAENCSSLYGGSWWI